MWTEKQLQKLKQDGKITGYSVTQSAKNGIKSSKNGKKCAQNGNNRSKEKDWLAWNLAFWSNENSLELLTEHKFDDHRLFRFDWALPGIKVAIEYEGLMSKKSRHTTAKGYTGDTEKYHLAQKQGWRLIRITALNYKTILQKLNDYVPKDVHRKIAR